MSEHSDFWTALEAIATSAAVAVALFLPTALAAREQRRKHASALKLAELACQALGSNPTCMTGGVLQPSSWPASARSLIARMDDMPSDYIADAAALADFIWIADMLREALEVDAGFRIDPSLANGAYLLDTIPDLSSKAEERFAELRRGLRPHRFTFRRA